MMTVYKNLQFCLAVSDQRGAELKGIGSILSEVGVEAKQSSRSTQSLRKTLSADMLSQSWMSRENSLTKSSSFYELSRNSYSESEEFSDLDSEDRSEEEDGDIFSMTDGEEIKGKEADGMDSEDRSEEEDGDISSMTDGEEIEGKEADGMDKVPGDLWSPIQSEKKQQKDSESSFFALMAPINKELKVDSSQWEPCKPYVHPAKRKSALSDQSLRLCTESLGCESGTDCSFPSLSDTDDSSSASSEDNCSVFGEEEEEEEEEESIPAESFKFSDNVSGSEQEKEIKSARSFPPPLSSIARSDGPCIHMRSYKQDGRLLLKAVPVETSQKYLRASREDGRLQLHFIRTQQQQLSPEEEKSPVEHEFNTRNPTAEEKSPVGHEFNAHNSTVEEKQLPKQQFKSSAYSDLSNLRRHTLRSEPQNQLSNKECILNLNSHSSGEVKESRLPNSKEIQGSNRNNCKEMNSFSKVPFPAAAAYTGFKDFPQNRPSQSLVTSPSLLYYKPLYSAAADFESKESAHSLPKFPCNESFRRRQVKLLTTKLPQSIAIS